MIQKILKKEIGKNTKLEYWLTKVIEKWTRGIGVSRHEVYKSTGGTSPFVHSYSTLTRYTGVVKSFIAFAKENGASKLKHITRALVRSFFEKQIQNGVSQKTLKVQMCALEKAFSQFPETQKFAYEVKEHFQDWHAQAQPHSVVSAYENPERIISWLYQHHYTLSGTIAEIMALSGVRLGDIKKMEVQDNKVIVHGSKGGRDRSFEVPQEVAQRISSLLQKFQELTKNSQEWTEIRRSGKLYKELKSACSSLKEIYSGFHGFRAYYSKVSFARHLADKVKEENINKDEAKTYLEFYDSTIEKLFDKFLENYQGTNPIDKDFADSITVSALKEVSEELGHNRISIAKHYVKS